MRKQTELRLALFAGLLACLMTHAAFAAETQGLEVPVGKAKFKNLLQFWALNDTSASQTKFNFRLRRAELKFEGSVAPETRWFVMIDPAKSLRLNSSGELSSTNDNKVLQDLGVAFMPFENFEIVGGQFKTPTTAEGLDSSGELLFPERSFTARNWGDKRDPGVMVTYKQPTWKVSSMVSNGVNTNVDDTSDAKDLHFRGEVNPVEPITVGAFYTAPNVKFSEDERVGVNARAKMDKLLLRSEMVINESKMGLVVDAGYMITDQIQPVARYETVDFDAAERAKATTFGLNYYHANHNAKIQAAYTLLDSMSGSNGSPTTSTTAGENGLFVLSMQMAL